MDTPLTFVILNEVKNLNIKDSVNAFVELHLLL